MINGDNDTSPNLHNEEGGDDEDNDEQVPFSSPNSFFGIGSSEAGPSSMPSSIPTDIPTMNPSARPSGRPTVIRSTKAPTYPASYPSTSPSLTPTRYYSAEPSSQPSEGPSPPNDVSPMSDGDTDDSPDTTFDEFVPNVSFDPFVSDYGTDNLSISGSTNETLLKNCTTGGDSSSANNVCGFVFDQTTNTLVPGAYAVCVYDSLTDAFRTVCLRYNQTNDSLDATSLNVATDTIDSCGCCAGDETETYCTNPPSCIPESINTLDPVTTCGHTDDGYAKIEYCYWEEKKKKTKNKKAKKDTKKGKGKWKTGCGDPFSSSIPEPGPTFKCGAC